MENKIETFCIEGLFGEYDITIPMEEGIRIFIGSNGLGKTHVLNILYYTLTQNFKKLFSFNFEKVILTFSDGQIVSIPRQKISDEDLMKDPAIQDLIEDIGIDKFLKTKKQINTRTPSTLVTRDLENIDISIFSIIRRIRKAEKFIIPKSIKAIEEFSSNKSVLYLPTFRRVEEEIKNLGYNENSFEVDSTGSRSNEDPLINFGMSDVQERFYRYTDEIIEMSKNGFSRISGEILSQLVNGLPETDSTFLDEVNHEDINIILARVGTQISIEDKKRIKEILHTKEIRDKDHSLLYFLQKLIDIYEEQKELDQSIRTFVDVCNKYLVNKRVVYDESEINIYIKKDISEISDLELDLSHLSSGEKQVISIFAKIYLDLSSREHIILIDEPELSLSVFWQEMLLPDILNSGKCNLLVAATHSPFIYEDESVGQFAIGLNEYITRRN